MVRPHHGSPGHHHHHGHHHYHGHHHHGGHMPPVRFGNWGVPSWRGGYHGGWGNYVGIGLGISSFLGHIINDVTRANDYYGYYGPTAHGHPRGREVAYAPEAEWRMPPMAGGHRGFGGLIHEVGSLFHGTGVTYAPEVAAARPERPEERRERLAWAKHEAESEAIRSRAREVAGIHPGDENAWLREGEAARAEAAMRAAGRRSRRERS